MKNNYKTSYGIISYSINKGKIKFLLVQKKYSHSYVALLRGHYNLHDMEYIRALVERLVPLERKKLLDHDHDYLWEKLWSFSNNNVVFKKQRMHAKKKFEELKLGIRVGTKKYSLRGLIDQIKPKWNEPEWGFPKGKKIYSEKESETALREFLEETGIPDETIYVHPKNEITPIYEEYRGDDGIYYRHIYYLARSELPGIGFTDPWSLTQVAEIAKVGWFDSDTAIKMIRPYHTSRISSIEMITKYLLEK